MERISKIGRWSAGMWLRSSLANKYEPVSFTAFCRDTPHTYDGAFFQGQLAPRVEATGLVQESVVVVEEVVVKQILVWEEGLDQKVVAVVAAVVVVVVGQGIDAGIEVVVVV